MEKRPHIRVRGIYGGVPRHLLEGGGALADYGVNAIWIGSGGINAEVIDLLRKQGSAVYAEFNTLHDAAYVEQHPDAAPCGPDGLPAPPPDGWQGVCPTHPGYRGARMETFRALVEQHPIDGVWLDYHHSHASWEQAEPNMPDTCFCERCLDRFSTDCGIPLPPGETVRKSLLLLDDLNDVWVQWRCRVFTDWVREFRGILDAARPDALLGTYHCPWSDTDHDGALRRKLAIDLKSQAEYVDVFSTMPYHARFGHAADPAWISRQTAWLGAYLGIQGGPQERRRIWPIVQLSDWGEHVPPSQVAEVLDHGTRLPATGVMVFNWGGLQRQMENVEEMSSFYRAIAPQ